jgi:hypothetical protein
MIQTIDIAEKNQLPRILLDYNQGYILFQGSSFASNAYDFYVPIFNWLENFATNPTAKTTVEFKFEYVNSSSIKSISKVLTIIKPILEKSKVVFKWYYKADDEDIKEMGEEFEYFLGVKFEFIEY